jgi:hypothetical protein
MIICHSRKFIFISNPKTGSTSIDSALVEYNEDSSFNDISEDGLYTKRHVPAYVLERLLSDDIWKGYFKFAFVRNSWDWFVSQHFYNLEKHGCKVDINTRLSEKQILETYEFLKMYRGSANAESGCQYAFLCNDDNAILVNYVGRFETLGYHFQEVQKIIGTNKTLPHLNPSKHRHYRTYYNDETKSLISNLYKTDIGIWSFKY